MSSEDEQVDGGSHGTAGLAGATLGALGVVYGDIGTSPLYAFRESFESAGHELPVSSDNVLGIVSLIFWSLILIISVKYLAFVMRADNGGEGGILALTSLVTPLGGVWGRRRKALVLLGLFGTALLFGDGMITPAISVLAAVEGSTVVVPDLEQWIVPIAVAIIVGLFAIQRWGTARVGALFGPVMVLWFTVLGVLGLMQVAARPEVLAAVNPVHGFRFLVENGFEAFLALGSVFLVVTGGEALYADMGHFGRRPIQVGWYVMVLPGLALNYFGQGALLLGDPTAIDQPFYGLAPSWVVLPLVVLATGATVIASQALISGVYSLTMQAVQFGYSPRLRIDHTSPKAFGQVYIPAINWALMVACIGLVVGFRSSSALAAAYGVAVTATMVITTLVFVVILRERFRWPLPVTVGFVAVVLTVEGGFFSANLFKIPDGGWFPLVIGVVVFSMFTTWSTGRRLLRERIRRGELKLQPYLDDLLSGADQPRRVPGVAAYLFGDPGVAPPALITNLRHNHVLHEQVLIVSVITEETPRVPETERTEVYNLGHGVHQVVVRFGFMEKPDLPRALRTGQVAALGVDPDAVTYVLGAESLKVTGRPGMARWREHLFAIGSRNATSAADYFGLPSDQTVVLGIPVEL